MLGRLWPKVRSKRLANNLVLIWADSHDLAAIFKPIQDTRDDLRSWGATQHLSGDNDVGNIDENLRTLTCAGRTNVWSSDRGYPFF